MPWVMVVRFSSEPGVMHLVDSLLFLSSTGLFIVTYWGAGRRAGERAGAGVGGRDRAAGDVHRRARLGQRAADAPAGERESGLLGRGSRAQASSNILRV